MYTLLSQKFNFQSVLHRKTKCIFKKQSVRTLCSAGYTLSLETLIQTSKVICKIRRVLGKNYCRLCFTRIIAMHKSVKALVVNRRFLKDLLLFNNDVNNIFL